MARAPLLIGLGVVAFVRAAAAEPCGDASALRADLEHESARADHWVLAWRIVYSAAAVGQFAVAASGAAGRDNTRALWVGGAESSIAALGLWFAPLEIDVPPEAGDACADRTALRAAAERAAREERRGFWLSHIGGLAVNVAGALVVSELTSWKSGVLSFATGYPVGLLQNYTMPRASWHRTREPAWTASIVTGGGGRAALVVAGSF